MGGIGLFGESDAEFLIDYLALDDSIKAQVVRGYVIRRSNVNRHSWIEDRIRSLPGLTQDQKAALFLLMDNDSKTWAMVDESEQGIQEKYWQYNQWLWINKSEDLAVPVQKYLKYGHPWKAALVFTHQSRSEIEIDCSLLVETLEALTADGVEEWKQRDLHELAELLDQLEKCGKIQDKVKIRFEWFFLPLVDDWRQPTKLCEAISKDPHLFVDLITTIYVPDGETPKNVSDQQAVQAELAHTLLRKWQKAPRLCMDGDIDTDALRTWITTAQDLLDSSGHRENGDRAIGRMLAFSKTGKDEMWPHQAVRACIEEFGGSEMQQGFLSGATASRGVTMRHRYEGGDQETALANKYDGYARQLQVQWPTTARWVRAVARYYRSNAVRRNRDADLLQDLG